MSKMLCYLFVFCFCACDLSAQNFDIGKHGSTLILPDPWQRRVLRPDLGKDQFIKPGGQLYMILTEEAMALNSDAKLNEYLLLLADEITGDKTIKDQHAVIKSNVNGARTVSKRLDLTLSGFKICYYISLIEKNGLAVVINCWGTQFKQLEVLRTLKSIHSGLKFPKKGSAWDKGLSPSEHTINGVFKDYILSYSDSLTTKITNDNILLELSIGTDVSFYMLEEQDHEDLEDAMEQINSVIIDGTQKHEIVHKQYGKVGEYRCVDWTIRLPVTLEGGKVHNSDIAVKAIDLGNNQYLDMRMTSNGPIGEIAKFKEMLFGNIKINKKEEIDAFPTVTVADEDTEGGIIPSIGVLLQQLQLHSTIDGWLRQDGLYFGNDVIIYFGNRVLKQIDIKTKVVTDIFHGAEWNSVSSPCVANKKVHFCNAEGFITYIQDGNAEATKHKAEKICPHPTYGIISLKNTSTSEFVPGIPASASNVYALAYINNKDEEVILHENLRGYPIALSSIKKINTVLLAIREGDYNSPISVFTFDLDNKTLKRHSHWTAITRVCGSANGWVINGTPKDEQKGSYFLAADKLNLQTIIQSSYFEAVHMSDKQISFLSQVGSGQRLAGYSTQYLYQCERANRPLPLVSGEFSKHAFEQLMKKCDKNNIKNFDYSQASLKKVFEELNAASIAVLQLPLPNDPTTLDAVLSEYSDLFANHHPDLFPYLAAMVNNCLLNNGAQWEKSSDYVDQDISHKNMFAVGANPYNIVLYAIYDTENTYEPIQTLLDSTNGRTIHISMNNKPLDSFALSDKQIIFAKKIRTDTQHSLELLEGFPKNTFALGKCVDELLASKNYNAVIALLSKKPQAELTEQLAVNLLAARFHKGIDKQQLQQFIDECYQAAGKYPNSSNLMLILATAYKQHGSLKKALACYNQCLNLYVWGDTQEYVESEIANLQELLNKQQ